MNGESTIPSCEARFPAVMASITAARHWVRDYVEGFGGPLRRHRMTQTAKLLVSEPITNAIRHGSGPPRIRLTWNGRWLRTAVSDSSDRWPRIRATAKHRARRSWHATPRPTRPTLGRHPGSPRQNGLGRTQPRLLGAVAELTINSVVHGAGPGALRIRAESDRIVCEVHDGG